MRQTMTPLAAMLVALLLVGCKMNLTTDIYSTDLRDAVAGTIGLTTPATLAMQVPSTDECDEHTKQISELMQGVVDDFAPKGCERADMDSFLLADIQIPIRASEEAWLQAGTLFGLVASQPHETKKHVVVALMMDRSKYETLITRMKKEFHQSVDLTASTVTMVLNNDGREPLQYRIRDVFLNGEPMHFTETRALERRRQSEIRLSNVGMAHLAREGSAVGFVIPPPEE